MRSSESAYQVQDPAYELDIMRSSESAYQRQPARKYRRIIESDTRAVFRGVRWNSKPRVNFALRLLRLKTGEFQLRWCSRLAG